MDIEKHCKTTHSKPTSSTTSANHVCTSWSAEGKAESQPSLDWWLALSSWSQRGLEIYQSMYGVPLHTPPYLSSIMWHLPVNITKKDRLSGKPLFDCRKIYSQYCGNIFPEPKLTPFIVQLPSDMSLHNSPTSMVPRRERSDNPSKEEWLKGTPTCEEHRCLSPPKQGR